VNSYRTQMPCTLATLNFKNHTLWFGYTNALRRLFSGILNIFLATFPIEQIEIDAKKSYLDATTAGGSHVPSPAGKIEGGVSLGQYRRITR
jgi:hypothetical protein